MLTEAQVRESLIEAQTTYKNVTLLPSGKHFHEGLIEAYDAVLNEGILTATTEQIIEHNKSTIKKLKFRIKELEEQISELQEENK